MSSASRAAVVRLATGSLLLLRPDLAAAALGAPVGHSHPVLRVLGARQVAQAALSIHGLGPRGRVVAATVDGLHAASCVGLAWLRPGLRTPALRNGGVATLFAGWGLLGSRTPSIATSRARC